MDDDGLEARTTLELQVTGGGNVPPVVLSRPRTTGLVGDAWTYDDDGVPVARGDRPMVWSLGKQLDGERFGAPPGAVVDAQTGRITWTPTGPGVVPVVLVVENPAGVTAQQFEIIVDGDLTVGETASGGCACGSSDAPSSMFALFGLGIFLVLRRGHSAAALGRRHGHAVASIVPCRIEPETACIRGQTGDTCAEFDHD
jgi:MYXO-CTERM domain-containing protein